MNIKKSNGQLQNNVTEYLFRTRNVRIPEEAWSVVQIPDYLQFNIRVIDESGNILAQDRDLGNLKSKLAKEIQSQFNSVSLSAWGRNDITYWDFDNIPEVVEMETSRGLVYGYPALVVNAGTVSLRLFDTREKARMNMQPALKRLFMLTASKDFKYLIKNLSNFRDMSVYYASTGNAESLREDLVDLITGRTFLPDERDIRTRTEFEQRRKEGLGRLIDEANRLCDLVNNILKRFNILKQQLANVSQEGTGQTIMDINDHLQHLVYDGFLRDIPYNMLIQYPRYLDAIAKRMEKMVYSPQKDEKMLIKLRPFWSLYKELEKMNNDIGKNTPNLLEYRFMLEEFRVSLFAQELGTAMPVSSERLQKYVNKIRSRPETVVV